MKAADEAEDTPTAAANTVDGLGALQNIVRQHTGVQLPDGWRASLPSNAVHDAAQSGDFISPDGRRFRTMGSVVSYVQQQELALPAAPVDASSTHASVPILLPMSSPLGAAGGASAATADSSLAVAFECPEDTSCPFAASATAAAPDSLCATSYGSACDDAPPAAPAPLAPPASSTARTRASNWIGRQVALPGKSEHDSADGIVVDMLDDAAVVRWDVANDVRYIPFRDIESMLLPPPPRPASLAEEQQKRLQAEDQQNERKRHLESEVGCIKDLPRPRETSAAEDGAVLLRAPDASPPSLLNPTPNLPGHPSWISGVTGNPDLRDGVLLAEGAIHEREWWDELLSSLERTKWDGTGVNHLFRTQWYDERRTAAQSTWTASNASKANLMKLQHNVCTFLALVGIFGVYNAFAILTRALNEDAEGEDQLYHIDSDKANVISIMVTGAVGRYIKFAHRDKPTWIPPWSILVFGSILCHKGTRSVKGADIICRMNINGTQRNANLTNIALHFYAGKGYISNQDAVTEPCAAYESEGLYAQPPNSNVHQRTERRMFDNNGSLVSDSLEEHTRRIEAAVRTPKGKVCSLEEPSSPVVHSRQPRLPPCAQETTAALIQSIQAMTIFDSPSAP